MVVRKKKRRFRGIVAKSEIPEYVEPLITLCCHVRGVGAVEGDSLFVEVPEREKPLRYWVCPGCKEYLKNESSSKGRNTYE